MKKDLRTLRTAIAALGIAAFAIVADAQYTAIYTFNCVYDGCSPYYADLLAQGQDGLVYGTMPMGVGGTAYGSLFAYPAGGPVTIYGLKNPGEPDAPYSGLTLGIDGNLYGASVHGGVNNGSGSTYGMIFKIADRVITPIHYFAGGNKGSYPYAPPIQGPDGNLYGVTSDGEGSGKVYQVVLATGKLGWIHPLPSGSRAPLILANDGNFYGTVPYGGFTIKGVPPENNDGGAVFRVTPSGVLTGVYNIYAESAHNNDHGDGSQPWGPVMQGKDGALYGTASEGGAHEGGVIYRLTLDGAYTVLHNLQALDGTQPNGGLVQGSDGYLYGLASEGGPVVTPYVAAGTLFKIQSNGHNFERLFSFYRGTGGRGPGSYPSSTPLLHTSGLIYGLTASGGKGITGSSTYGSYDDGGELFRYKAGLKPFISIVGVRAANVGDHLELLGHGFKHATGVKFGSISVPWNSQSVTVWSDTYMTVTVPAGATVGPVTVIEPGGDLSTLFDLAIKKGSCEGLLCSKHP